MSKLVIGNQLTEETVEGENAIPGDYAAFLGIVSHRMLWLADRRDIVVLPSAPDPDFAHYVWETLGIADDAPTVLIPQAGRQGASLLYRDRLRDEDFLAELATLIAANGVDRIAPFYFDEDITWLADRLGLDARTPGFDFLQQRGNELVNSKSFFRTIGSGNGIDLPKGQLFRTRYSAEEFIWSLISAGCTAIVKQDNHGGGFGNEILTPTTGREWLGATRVTTIGTREELAAHLATAFSRYTANASRPVVIENYIPDSVPIYVELFIADEAVTVVGLGEMRMKKTPNGSSMTGLVIPPPSSAPESLARFLDSAGRLGAAVRAIGYRGPISIDAIRTPTGDIMFNEFNGRVGGSTHAHRIGELVIGGPYLQDRVLLMRSRCSWSSLPDTLRVLREHGLAYDPATRTGVLITGDDWQYMVVGETEEQASTMEDETIKVLGLDEN